MLTTANAVSSAPRTFSLGELTAFVSLTDVSRAEMTRSGLGESGTGFSCY
jgi:hypothetical protein